MTGEGARSEHGEAEAGGSHPDEREVARPAQPRAGPIAGADGVLNGRCGSGRHTAMFGTGVAIESSGP